MATLVPTPGDTTQTEWAQAAADAANELLSGQIKIASGAVSITPTTPETLNGHAYFRSGGITVTFPSGLFSSAPTVITGANSQYPGRVIQIEHATSVSATGCSLQLARTDQTATDVHWIAIGT